MEAFTILEAVAAPLDRANVDTGQILPARFLRRPRKEGYGQFLFHDWRFDEDGHERREFVLNQPAYRAARILVADRNFGAGSSREQALWGLIDHGIRCLVAADYGDIFYANAMKAGLLPVVLPAEDCARLRAQLHAQPGATLCIDLARQTVTGTDGRVCRFEIDPFRKRCLLEGLDDIGLTLKHEAEISAFEQRYRNRFDWLFDGASQR